MKKTHIRKEIIDHLIELKRNEIKKLEESHKIYAESADLDEESSLELDDFSQQNQSTDAARNLQLRIDREKDLLNQFINLKPELVPEITEGNVVFTDKVNMVIGLAFKDFEWNGKRFVGISTSAPIFEALVGKRENDTLNFNGIDYTIEEIL
ncbi:MULTISPECIES: hypothetical protein [Weeksella]|uniref:Transcription elongation factor n=2 Tax=Weeksella virosa TaxID=1014 RepID=F0NZV2_WEEVC|nr:MULTISPECIES: hypothetical protein [Weeksella]ADX68376.1 hypothetical protein Weevi_1683 [Weeksella virosa DSM 16922]MDK7375762.1 hypothetical protein [Weeksella virosa]MDK7674662.1 hypothetical protein [Weeksella virosa]OFM83161.1 hypothetical protein HMPREF2660_02445 [Weeksella sp. HMSC059D05]SUP54704.1 Uncharacterised protein [Weeksella virosa]